MYRFAQSKVVYLCVCVSLLAAVSLSLLSAGTLPTFGAGLLPAPEPAAVSQSPFPPPHPDAPWLTLAQSPLPPPHPDDPWLTLA